MKLYYSKNGYLIKWDDLSQLKNGDYLFYFKMFDKTEIEISFPNLLSGRYMFYQTNLTSFSGDLSSRFNGYQMFYNCKNLKSVSGDLSGLLYGINMFYNCNNLTTFTSDLSSLINGDMMFSSCKLNKESVKNIINCLKNSNTCSEAAFLTLGIDASLKTNTELQTLLGITEDATSTKLTGHGGGTWYIKLEWN